MRLTKSSNAWKRGVRAARILALSVGLAGLAFAAAWRVFPFPGERLTTYPAATVLTDREGRPMRIRLGPDDVDCRPEYRFDPADWIGRALVAAEDRRFWTHHGVDPLALLRAMSQNLAGRRTVSGASTLSTQVIRLIEPRRRTLSTKLIEAFRALQMERQLGKEAILEQYLNRAPFGSNLYGIEAASRRYFGKDPHSLSLAEAALLAGLPQSPSRLRPDRHLARARIRQAYVLERMEYAGMITAAQREEALRQPLIVRAERTPFRHPHFCDFVWTTRAAAERPARLRTTLDPTMQQLAEKALARHAAGWREGGIVGGAIVVLDVRTGAVRAMAGSPDFENDRAAGQVNGAAAPRSAGSTLKPFIFARAMDRGELTPATVLADVPRAFAGYRPENFDGTFAGLVPARDALILSLNMPALALVERMGVAEFHGTLRRLGFDTLRAPSAHYGLGLALGNGSVRLIDLVNAYACLARGGMYKPYTVLEAEAAEGMAPGRRLFSAEAAWLVNDILGGDERALEATGHRAEVDWPRAAWKTGTSSGFRDAWTVAYNSEYVVGVWVGNPDGSGSSRLVGVETAAPVALALWRALYPDNRSPWFVPPAGLRKRTVCTVSGEPAGPHCAHRVEALALAGTTRFEPCRVHLQAPPDGGEAPARWPADVEAFLAAQRVTVAATGEGAAPGLHAGPKIVSPARGLVLRHAEGLGAEVQRLPLTAAGGTPGEPLYWFIDDRCLGQTLGSASCFWPIEKGQHRLVCADARGRFDSVTVRVE